MSGTRVQIDLFFKDMTPAQVNDAFPALLPAIRNAKERALSVTKRDILARASYHICRHDEDGPCEREINI